MQAGNTCIAFCLYATFSSPLTALLDCYCYSWKLNLTIFLKGRYSLKSFKIFKIMWLQLYDINRYSLCQHLPCRELSFYLLLSNRRRKNVYIMLGTSLPMCLWQDQCVMFLLLIDKWLMLDDGHCLFELSEIIQFFMKHSIFSKLRNFPLSAVGRSSSWTCMWIVGSSV